MPGNDSNSNPAPAAKKGKKKSHKKKAKKSKQEIYQSQEEDDDNDYESLSDASDKDQQDDEEEFIPGVGALASSGQGQSESTKLAAAMIYHYESTQLEDQIHVMIRQLAEECNLSKEVVSETVNRMFESGLQYDDHDEVLKMLKPKAPGSSVTAVKALAPVADVPAVSSNLALDADAAAALARFNTLGSSTHSFHHNRSEHHGVVPKHGREIDALSIDTAPAAVSHAPAPPAAVAPSGAAACAPESMKEKLNYVATYSQTSLYDSLAALCSWASVSLPAGASNDPSARSEKEQKMDAFFHSQALEILLTTLFSDEQQQLSRAEVKGAFQTLLQHVLLLQADPQGTSSVHQITEALAQLVSQVYALRNAQVVPSFASSSARGNQIIAQQIAACVKKLYLQLSFNSSAGAKSAASDISVAGNENFLSQLEAIDVQLQGLEKSTKKNTSATDAAQEKVQNMFLSREIHADKVQLCFESVKKLANQQAPKLSSAAVQRPAPAAPSANATDLSRSVAESSSLIEHILLSEFDNATLGSGALSPVSASSLQTKHQQSHHIKSTFEVVIHERDTKMAALNHELSAHNVRLQELNAHKQRLLEQVRLCDVELNNVGGRLKALTTDLSNATYFYQQQLDQLVQTGNTVRKSLQAHDQVNSLITAVRTFETKFAEALLYQHAAAHASAPHVHTSNGVARNTTVITSSAAGMQVKNSAGVTTSSTGAVEEAKAELAERVLLLTNAVQSYVAAEAQCIQFLAQRVTSAQAKQAVARKELLAYAALMMKGQVVTNAEATVSQLDAEINEDVQAVRQLQQNVADTLTQIRTVNGSGRVVNGKVATSTFKYPASELALIVHFCHSIGVTPAAEIVLLADKAPVQVVAPAPAPQPMVASAPSVVTSTAPVSSSVPRAPRADKPTAGSKDTRSNSATTTTKTDRDSSRRERDNSNKQGSKRHNDAQKSEVDTVSAIQQLERSCLQKPSTGSAAPVKVAATPLSTRTVPAPRAAGASSAPINSVWKVPAANSANVGGHSESKSESEGVKTLKEIQAEQQKEKQKLLQQKQHAAAAAFSPAVVAVVLPPAVATTDKKKDNTKSAADTPVEEASSAIVVESISSVDDTATATTKADTEKTPSKSPKKKAKATAADAATSNSEVVVTPVKSSKKKDKSGAHTGGVVEDSTKKVEGEADGHITPQKSASKSNKKTKDKIVPTSTSTHTDTVHTVKPVDEIAVEADVCVAVVEPAPAGVVGNNESKAVEEVAQPEPLEESVEEVEELQQQQQQQQQDGAQIDVTVSQPVEAAVESPAVAVASPAEETSAEHVHTPSKTHTTADSAHSTPISTAASAGDLSAQEHRESSNASLTPTSVEVRPPVDFTSPLVEFHHAYKIKEIGIPVVDNDEGDVNPMKRGLHSPVVNYNNTYPELEEECELLIEMEVDDELGQSTDDERDTTGPDSASEAGDLSFTFNSQMIGASAASSVTSNRSISKMRDINPMTRASPGKGSRVRLDISQQSMETDVAVAVEVAHVDPHAEEKVDTPGTDAESSELVDKSDFESMDHTKQRESQSESQNEAGVDDSVPKKGSAFSEAAPVTPARTVRSLRFAVYSGAVTATAETPDDN